MRSGGEMFHKDTEPVVVVCAADANYVRPMAVMLQSVLVNLNPNRLAVIYILDGGIATSDKKKMEGALDFTRLKIHWVPLKDSLFSGVPIWGRMPVSTYYKLAIDQALPAAVRKAIWLDCDLLVVNDLGRLWDIGLAGHPLLAVQDALVPFVSSRCGIANYERIGLPPDAKYFNAGVMVVDLDLWRRNEVTREVIEYIREFREDLYFWDQEGLNAVLAGKWGQLDPRWNYNACIPERIRFSHNRTETIGPSQEPWIIHFAGNLKPWLYPSRDVYKRLYFRYLDMTDWAGWRPKTTIVGSMVRTYESSGLRSVLYPLEQVGMRIIRASSRRYIGGSL